MQPAEAALSAWRGAGTAAMPAVRAEQTAAPTCCASWRPGSSGCGWRLEQQALTWLCGMLTTIAAVRGRLWGLTAQCNAPTALPTTPSASQRWSCLACLHAACRAARLPACITVSPGPSSCPAAGALATCSWFNLTPLVRHLRMPGHPPTHPFHPQVRGAEQARPGPEEDAVPVPAHRGQAERGGGAAGGAGAGSDIVAAAWGVQHWSILMCGWRQLWACSNATTRQA